MAPVKRPIGERALAKFDIDSSGCWLWSGKVDRYGYGKVWVSGAREAIAHRVVYETVVGPIPDGLVIDHLCRTPACVNPDHLDPVPQRENLMRGEHPWVQKRKAIQAGHATHSPRTRSSRISV